MINKEQNGYCIHCDGCSNSILMVEAKDYKELHASAKESGWINRKINEEWLNFCSDVCYQNKIKLLSKCNSIDNQDKSGIFDIELNYITNDTIKEQTKQLLNELPDYFFNVATSSTGKYHPKYCQGQGGLVRHTKAAVRVAVELLRLEYYQNANQWKDYIIASLILHDGLKHGYLKEDGTHNPYSDPKHPAYMTNFIVEKSKLLQPDAAQFLSSLVLTHMGQWNFNDRTGEYTAPKPQSSEQHFVHLCDYLASRKCMEIDSNEPFVL